MLAVLGWEILVQENRNNYTEAYKDSFLAKAYGLVGLR